MTSEPEILAPSSGMKARILTRTHLGWREVDGEWFYLHDDGAIGPLGPVDRGERPMRLARRGAREAGIAGLRAAPARLYRCCKSL
jgi:hypothetical protein